LVDPGVAFSAEADRRVLLPPWASGVRQDVAMLHELWVDGEGLDLFVLAGSRGDYARQGMTQPVRLIWTVEAASHFEAMVAYYRFRGRSEYTTAYPEWDCKTYREHGWE
jgi:hypothetical protein